MQNIAIITIVKLVQTLVVHGVTKFAFLRKQRATLAVIELLPLSNAYLDLAVLIILEINMIMVLDSLKEMDVIDVIVGMV
jgi:hypothetical protein